LIFKDSLFEIAIRRMKYMSRNSNGKFGLGAILVTVGLLMILSNLGVIPSICRLIGTFWPLVLIFISLLFHVGYYSNPKNVGLLVPGGILLTVGIVCQCSMLWGLWRFMWPGFILAPAVGLFELYIFGKRDKGLLIPIGILSGMSLIFFTMTFNTLGRFAKYLIPVLLIVIGLIILNKNRRNANNFNESNNAQDYNNSDF
jgi:uncharacterized membrane protein